MAALRPHPNTILSRYLIRLALPILFPTADSRINELIALLAEMLKSRNSHLDQSLSSSERTVRLFLENLDR